jgi:phosphotriesterase-related protein
MTTGTLVSVQGDVAAAEMRWICPHEHLLISMGEYQGETISKYPGNLEYARRQLVRMLVELRQIGINGLVDATPMGIGRDHDYARFAKTVSAESGVHVFLVTGLYERSRWPGWATERTALQLADMYVRELETGIGDTGVRPALLKAAVDEPFGEQEEKALTACAMAQRRTGVAVHVHATAHRRAIVDLITSHGVPPSRIYLAHVDMGTSEDEWLWLAEQGVRLVTTNWDFPFNMDQVEARRLVRLLISNGHLDKLLVSIDFALTIESRWCVGTWTWDNADRTSYAYLHTGVLPILRADGITDEQIGTMMHDNTVEMLTRR